MRPDGRYTMGRGQTGEIQWGRDQMGVTYPGVRPAGAFIVVFWSLLLFVAVATIFVFLDTTRL